MNLEVVKRYVDRHSLKEVDAETILYDVPEERAMHLIREGVVVEIDDEDHPRMRGEHLFLKR